MLNLPPYLRLPYKRISKESLSLISKNVSVWRESQNFFLKTTNETTLILTRCKQIAYDINMILWKAAIIYKQLNFVPQNHHPMQRIINRLILHFLSVINETQRTQIDSKVIAPYNFKADTATFLVISYSISHYFHFNVLPTKELSEINIIRLKYNRICFYFSAIRIEQFSFIYLSSVNVYYLYTDINAL